MTERRGWLSILAFSWRWPIHPNRVCHKHDCRMGCKGNSWARRQLSASWRSLVVASRPSRQQSHRSLPPVRPICDASHAEGCPVKVRRRSRQCYLIAEIYLASGKVCVSMWCVLGIRRDGQRVKYCLRPGMDSSNSSRCRPCSFISFFNHVISSLLFFLTCIRTLHCTLETCNRRLRRTATRPMEMGLSSRRGLQWPVHHRR